MNQKLLSVACIQQSMSSDIEANIEQAKTLVHQAAECGAQLVVIPELFAHRYFCQTHDADFFELAESIPNPMTELFSKIAKILAIVIVLPVFEKSLTGLYYNSAVVIDADGSIAGSYRKIHIPDDPGFHEKYYFSPGEQGFKPILTRIGKLGVMICWDQWFPEAARAMALNGADVLIYPTAIGWEPSDVQSEKERQLNAWQIIQQSHAIANHLPVIVANRIGFEPKPHTESEGIEFWGHSFICDGFGKTLNTAKDSESTVIVSDINLAETKTLRHTWPFLRDRRGEHYQ